MKKKVDMINSVYSVGKNDKMLITLKKDMFGCFRIKENEVMAIKQV